MSDVKISGVDQSAQRVVAMPVSQNSKVSEAGVDAAAKELKSTQVVQALSLIHI